jgi:hypothetical protein
MDKHESGRVADSETATESDLWIAELRPAEAKR